MPVINYLWSKECTLVDQDHHACEHCPSWYAVQQNDYHLNSICLMATIKFIVTICQKKMQYSDINRQLFNCQYTT